MKKTDIYINDVKILTLDKDIDYNLYQKMEFLGEEYTCVRISEWINYPKDNKKVYFKHASVI